MITIILIMALVITGCENVDFNSKEQTRRAGSDEKKITVKENTGMKSETIYPPGQEPPSGSNVNTATIKTLMGNDVTVYPGYCNCHGYAWSVGCGFPNSAPNYQIEYPDVMYNDGSYSAIAWGSIYDPIPCNVNVGDKVVYSYDNGYITHSAIVEQINPPIFRSYNIYSMLDPVGVVSRSPNYFYDKLMDNGLPFKKYGLNLTYYRIGKSTFVTGVPARKIAIKAKYNGKYVCADVNYAYPFPLFSNRDTIKSWETFDLINNSDSTVSLWSHATGNYVKAYEKYRAEASSCSIGDAEKFYLEICSDYVYFKWKVNSRYIHYDSFTAGCQGTGPGERFILIYLD